MIRIAIPQTQRAVREHLEKSGFELAFKRGTRRSANSLEGPELYIGNITKPVYEEGQLNVYRTHEVVQLRTMDAIYNVALGRCDVGIVGSDAVIEKAGIWPVQKLDEYHYGRALGERPPRLEIVAHGDSKARSPLDIKTSDIFYTERVNITKVYLEDLGHNVLIEGNESPREFRRLLQETGSVGIHVMLGSAPAQLAPEGEFGVMVNESGDTVDDYNLRVIDEIMPVHTWLVANPNSMFDEVKRETILQLQRDLSEATHGKEFINRNISIGPERDI